MTTKNYEIRIGRTEIDIPHEKGRITFVSPIAGFENYVNVQEQITKKGLRAPNFGEVVSLVYTANQNPDEPEFVQVLNKLDNRWLWAFTGNIYEPKGKGDYQNGVLIEDNPQIKNGRVSLVKSKLVKRLEAGDKRVRFVPNGYKTGIQKPSELAKNSLVIGWVGEEGAEKLAKVSEKYIDNLRVWSLENVEEEIVMVSSLGCGFLGKLVIRGEYYDKEVGYALGIKPEGKRK